MPRTLTRHESPTAAVGTPRPRASRAVHRVNEMTTKPFIAVWVALAVVAMWIVIIATGFNEHIQFAFGSVCAGVTVTMVFVLQHTQRRSQSALQLELDRPRATSSRRSRRHPRKRRLTDPATR